MRKTRDARLSEAIAYNLRRFRTTRGWTLQYMAQRTGKSLQWMALLESGRENPTLGTIGMLAAALGVPIQELTRLPTRCPSCGRIWEEPIA